MRRRTTDLDQGAIIADHLPPRPPGDQRFRADVGSFRMTGIDALVRLVLDVRRADRRAGLATAGYVSGYEGSPLGGYDIALERQLELLDDLDIVFQPGVNEELAATAVQGTQLAPSFDDCRVEGIVGFWYGKSPGLDRASDALRHANLGGTHPFGGAVALVGDDPSAKSSTVPGASEQLLADLGIPTLYPADPQDVLDLGVHAVAMSRFTGLWSALKVVTNVADGSGLVDVDPHRVVPVDVSRDVDGVRFEHRVTARFLQPHLTGLERSRNGTRLELARRYAAANGLNRIVGDPDEARIGLVAAGKTYLDLVQALDQLGLDEPELGRRGIRLLRLAMVYPLEPEIIRRFADGLAEVIVVEEKRAFLETALKDLLYDLDGHRPVVSGKRTPDGGPLLPSEGELDPDVIAKALARRLGDYQDLPTVVSWQARRSAGAHGRTRPLLPLLTGAERTPYFCSGCPHNSSAKVPEGSLVGGGIGCHALVLVMEPTQVGDVTGLTQMGGEGAQWNGMFPFLAREHLVQNLGDGTFHHSGSLAVRAAVASGANITYKLLYNSAVAMTGGQGPTGGMSVAAITRALTAEGVARIIVTAESPRSYRRNKLAPGVEVWHRNRLLEAQETLARTPGVTVLIHDQECATELRRKRKRGLAPDPARRVLINERVCEGCGDCGVASNCLSVRPVTTEFGRKTQIDQSSCNKDYSCLDGDCPSFMTVVPRGGAGGTEGRRQVPLLDSTALKDPKLPATTRPYTMRLLGIGGSGVVTLSSILATAAAAAGKHVRSLDQTGLAQKGGAVVSDVKVSDAPVEQANKAGVGEVDLYLGADLLVAAAPANLATASVDRTVAVVSLAPVATGRMVVDASTEFPDTAELEARIRAVTRRGGAFLDARELSVWMFGDDQYANLILLGVAYQAGAVPIGADDLEGAVRANGVKVEANISAFRRGRQYIADPKGFQAAVDEFRPRVVAAPQATRAESELVAVVRAEPDSQLYRLVSRRVPELVRYQDARYARRYADVVEQVRGAESERVPASTALAEAVARNLYKLMAYKDEYEVARLIVGEAGVAEARRVFGAGAKVRFRLHPPVLKAIGLRRKISLGPWALPLLAVLARGRLLRGTPFDVFGRTQMRRTERALVEEYVAEITQLTIGLRPGTLARAIEIANLPDLIRGYDELKLRNIAVYRARLRDLKTDEPVAVG